MLEIFGALMALGILVLIHEGGHFLVAKLFKVKIEKFSIGFGPKLVAFTKGNTEFRIAIIPLGGYVKMKGENPDEQDTNDDDSFSAKLWWQRALIAFAGPFANLILGVVVFIFSYAIGNSYDDLNPQIGKINSSKYTQFQINDVILSVNDQKINGWTEIYSKISNNGPNKFLITRNDVKKVISFDPLDLKDFAKNVLPQSSAVIGEVAAGLPAYQAGLMNGDKIMEIDGKVVNNWYDIKEFIGSAKTDKVLVKIKRGDQTFFKTLNLENNPLGENRIIGVTQYLPLHINEKYSLSESVISGSMTAYNFIIYNYIGLKSIILKPSSLKSSIGGPVMLVAMSKSTIKKGWNSVLSLFASISLVLMIMNLLPIPILDGGQIFFCLIEGVRQKPLSQNVQFTLQRIGLSLLLLLMVFAFYNDFSKVLKRNTSLHEQPEKVVR